MILHYLIGLASGLLTLIVGRGLLSVLGRLHFGQTVRDDGPQSHLKKSGTPTMGGLMFLLPLLLVLLAALFCYRESLSAALLIFVFGMALIGFLDDYVKVRVRKEGLSVLQKTLPMLLLCLAFVLYLAFLRHPGFAPGFTIFWPFGLGVTSLSGIGALLYGLVLLVFLYFTTNAVNLTDGVDGLLSGVSMPIFLVVGFLLSLSGSDFGAGSEVRGAALSAFALTGGLAGFLFYNRHPAKVFMGDTGSLAVGALFSALVLVLDMPWMLFFAGFIYLVEALSVVVQVAYFKATKGKRIFRMSPIHHHFELGGWSEAKIVGVFSLTSALLSVLGLVLTGVFSNPFAGR